jgi:hypothetical protein
MPVPNSSFGTATAAIPLSQLDANFATPITLGNTAIQLGNTVTTLNNMTLANVTISSGTITITNVSVTTANVSGTANVSTLVVVGNATVGGNTTITGNITAANANVTSNLVLFGGTANGVAYLNTSKQVTTGSALVFDGSNLGLGVTPNTGWSSAKTLQIGARSNIWNLSDNTYFSTNTYFDGTDTKYIANSFAIMYSQQNDGAHKFYVAPSGTANVAFTFTNAMTLDASGNLFVGATALTSNLNYFAYSPGNTFADFGHITGVSSTTSYARFLYAGGVIGSITQNGTTSVNFNGYIVNPSDRKLKTNIVDAPSSLLLIDKIQIRSFNWVAEEKNQSYGVIAQELETVFPEAVNAPINEDGFYGVDYTKLVPMLVKAIQEQQALITQLTARITALEGA